MQHYIVDRSIKAKRGRSGFSGPDRAINIVSVPEGVAFDPASTPLHVERLAARDIKVWRIGEYYRRSTGPRSRYALLMDEAQAYIHSMRELGV